MDPIVTASLLSAGGGMLSAGGSIFTAKKNRQFTREENQRQRDWAMQSYERQLSDSIANWNRENAYNSPEQQMQRLKDAGLNPHLVYGNGATASGGNIPTPAMQQPKTSPERATEYGDIVANALSIAQQQANIAKTKADTAATNATAWSKDFDNKVKESLGKDFYSRRERYDNVIKGTKATMSSLEADVMRIVAGADNVQNDMFGYNLTKASPQVKNVLNQYAQTKQAYDNAKADFDIKKAIKVVKDFEASMAKQGISPNAPWFAKWLNDLVEGSTGQGVSGWLKSLFFK